MKEAHKRSPFQQTLGAAHTGFQVEGQDYYSDNRGSSLEYVIYRPHPQIILPCP